MKILSVFYSIIIILVFGSLCLHAQSNQTLANGASSTPVNFTGAGCTYKWFNNTPGIGLAASGTGNIPAFTAVNKGSTPIIATITAIPQTAGFAYISNGRDGTISVINTVTNTVVATIDGGTGPDQTVVVNSVTVSSDGSRVYVQNKNSIQVINALINKVIAYYPVLKGAALGLVLSPDNSLLYIASTTSVRDGVLYIYNTANNTLMSQVSLDFNPYYMAISADGTRLYFGNGFLTTVEVMNTATNAIIAIIDGVQQPLGLALTPDGRFLYVCQSTGNVAVISTATNSIVANIPTGASLSGIAVSPDGTKVYAANVNSYNVSVIDVATNKVTADIVVGVPYGISITPDGSKLYIAAGNIDSVYVASTTTNKVIKAIAVGHEADSFGNYITAGIGCDSKPITFTITVSPVQPVITSTAPRGSISACEGSISANPNIEQFSISGLNLSSNITATAPGGFDVSLAANSGYGSSVTLNETEGVVKDIAIYVRSTASAQAGNVSGNVVLSSAGADNQNVPVNAVIVALPDINAVTNQTIVSGAATNAIEFSGVASAFNWVNDTPAIGLAANGNGNITSFTAVNKTNSPITAIITVTPLNSAGCTGEAMTFTITVNRAPVPPTITAEGTLASLATQYGTPSSSESFMVTTTNLTSGVVISTPPGFELSTDNANYSSTVTLTAMGDKSPIWVYIRLSSKTPVGEYAGRILLSAEGATTIYLTVPKGSVTPAPLTVTAENKTKPYGAVNPVLTVVYSGFENFDTVGSLTTQPNISTTSATASAVGQYPIIPAGAMAANYIFLYVPGILTIESSSAMLAIPNTFTPNGDGINDTWDIKYLDDYPQSTVRVFNQRGQKMYSSVRYPKPWDGKYNGVILPAGTYYYIIKPGNSQPIISGWVAIIR